MKKVNIQKHINKKAVIVPTILAMILFWFVLTLWRITASDISFSVLTFSHGMSDLSSPKFSELLAKDKATGQFIAKENNLGIISIRFNTFNQISKDAIVFRIKKEGEDRWHYENKYNVNQFTHKELYPFGFPPIENSKDRTFIFEVISLNGKRGNSVALSEQYPIFTSHYQFKKDVILSSTSSMAEFLWKKTMRSFEQKDVLFASWIYLTPLLFYVPYLLKVTSFIKKYSLIYLCLLVIIDIILIQQILSSIYILLTIIFLLILNIKQLSSKYIFRYVIIFLVISVVFSLLKIDHIAEKTSAWSYILLLIGTGKSLTTLKT